jgi:mannosyltransferase OCH1-like enzyme
MSEAVIPKTIHYCWFGESDFGELELACMESWKRFCPGYEIKKWDETNFDIECNEFVSGAYRQGKWAFVSDFARFKILYEEGGVYLDTDVELVKNLDDLIDEGAYLGYEVDPDEATGVNGALASGLGMAFPAHDPFVAKVLESYERIEFPETGNLGDYTVVRMVTKLLESEGLKPVVEGQRVAGVRLLPQRYLNPMDRFTGGIDIDEDTVSIHHYSASWVSKSARMELALSSKFIRMGLPRRRALALSKVLAVVCCLDFARMRSFAARGSHGKAKE